MEVFDKKKLVEELNKLKEAEPAEEMADLRTLFLLLSGEKRTVKQTTMEDIAELFNHTSSILDLYFDNLQYVFHSGKLRDYKIENRRAV